MRFRTRRRAASMTLVVALLALTGCGSHRPAPQTGPPLTGSPLIPGTLAPGTAQQPGLPVPSTSAAPTPSSSGSPPVPSSPSPSPASPTTPPATGGGGTGSGGGTCTVGADLVPTCGVLWGAAAGGFTRVSNEQAQREWEVTSGRATEIFHTYHSGDQLFPTSAEIAMAHQAGHPRLLLLNWKVAAGSTWAKVAAGDEDARIDREAAYLKRAFTDPFFLVLHHEPEDDVNPRAGSGMTAADFAAMFRHTVLRLRADGVHNAVTVIAYMNYEKWETEPWWPDLYPGDDVVDWIATDSYLNADPGGFHDGDFASMMNRTTDRATFPGFYNWATSRHPGKPLMLAEWGVYGSVANKPSIFASVLPDLRAYPRLKAMVYFDTPKDQAGRDIRINTSPASTAAFRRIAADPIFDVHLPAR